MSLLSRTLQVIGTIARDALRRSSRSAPAASWDAPEDTGHQTPGGERGGQPGRPRGEQNRQRNGEPTQPGENYRRGADVPRTVSEYNVAERGLPRLQYAPHHDAQADPGEVVWAWVPYDENNGQGKDRPVLILARHEGGLLGVQLTSKDHDRDREDELRWGRVWIDVGSGAWDNRGRDSEARLDRVLFLPPDAVRREGAALDEPVYRTVAEALHGLHSQRGR